MRSCSRAFGGTRPRRRGLRAWRGAALTLRLRAPGTGLGNPNDEMRMGATFNTVFSPSSLQVPWYITGGTPDWQGNLSGAR